MKAKACVYNTSPRMVSGPLRIITNRKDVGWILVFDHKDSANNEQLVITVVLFQRSVLGQRFLLSQGWCSIAMTTSNILHATEHCIMYHHGRGGNAIQYLKATFSSLSFKVCYHSPCIIHHTVLYVTCGYSQIHDIGSRSQKAQQIP